MKGTGHTEEQIIHPKAGRSSSGNRGVMPAARHERTNVLPLEGEVPRHG
jgi:hypothetical protein